MKTLTKQIEHLIEKRKIEIHARIVEDKFSAPQSYIDDLKGYKRGISEMGNEIIKLIESYRSRRIKKDRHKCLEK